MTRYHLFISHSWNYTDKYEGLLKLLDSDKSFSYSDYSVPKNSPIHNAKDDKALYNAIKSQMQYAGVVLILAGVYATYSNWINKEITIAKTEFKVSKPIIAVEYWGSERTSRVVKDSADEIVKWQAFSIISAIRRLS